MDKLDKYEIVGKLARRRGFFWPSYEIYGGTSGFLTYGPLGTILKRRIEEKFRRFFIRPLGIMEIESSIVTPARVFEASGHVDAFREPMVECRGCHRKFRADHLLQEKAGLSDTETEKLTLQEISEELKKHDVKCPDCGAEFGQTEYFMTMFTTKIGPYSDAIGYGRPEAAQGIFVDFRRLHEVGRQKLPLGVVQIGHALRNEISPRQGPIRLREFTIADVEFFFDPEDPQCPFLQRVETETLRLIPAQRKKKGVKKALEVTAREALEGGFIETEWQAYFMVLAKRFLKELGVPNEKQRFIEKLVWERAHYSKQGYDQEIYLDRLGWTEVSGHNYRTDYDLKQHMKSSGVDMQTFKEYEKAKPTTRIVAEPVLAEIGPSFRKKASEVVGLLSKANVDEIQASFEQRGYFRVGSFEIRPEHVRFVRRQIEETGRRFLPHVVEPSFGIDRLVYGALEYAYGAREGRTLLRLPRELAPVQVGVFPLVTKGGLAEEAKRIWEELMDANLEVEYDESGSIGRRYARADEIGIPLCITIDYQTLKDNSVTIRNRDSWAQVRRKTEELPRALQEYLVHKIDFEDL